jgi:hypothetical protein
MDEQRSIVFGVVGPTWWPHRLDLRTAFGHAYASLPFPIFAALSCYGFIAWQRCNLFFFFDVCFFVFAADGDGDDGVPPTVGAGSMALPFCYRESGIFLATALVFVGAISAFYSIHLLAVASEATGRKSYEELVDHVFGKRVEIILVTHHSNILIFTF